MLLQSKEDSSGAFIDLTPVIDMVFLLLIFFLVATTFHQTEREMRIALPTAASGAPISELLREFVLNVDAEGRMFVAGRAVEAEELRSMLTDAVKRNPEQKVTLRGDKTTSYANIVRALDVCKGSGIQEPYLDTALAP